MVRPGLNTFPGEARGPLVGTPFPMGCWLGGRKERVDPGYAVHDPGRRWHVPASGSAWAVAWVPKPKETSANIPAAQTLSR